MSDLFKRILAPQPKTSIFRQDRAGRSGVVRVLAGLIVCLAITSLLSSARLVDMAERQSFGSSRDRWLSVAHAVDRTASALSLDRPADAIDEALGRRESDSTIILGELAAGAEVGIGTSAASGSKTVPAPGTTTPATAAAPTIASSSSAPLTTEAPDTTTPTTTTPTTTSPPTTVPSFGTVDVDHPLRVWFGGDSLGEYVGSQLIYRFVDQALATTELDFQISSGLSRPDYFDWPTRLSEVMQQEPRPQVVVFMAGGNDDQDMQVDAGRLPFINEQWEIEYRRRVATMMDITAYEGTQMVWINLPPMREKKLNTLATTVNSILADEASSRSWVTITDVGPTLSGSGGGYDQFIVDPDGGKTVRARTNDGVHLTPTASKWVAQQVWTHIDAAWTFDASVASSSTTQSSTQAPSPTVSSTG